jgi:hypothetical protein
MRRSVATVASPSGEPDERHIGARQFDFLYGRWAVRNRTLAQRLVGSTTWKEWDAELDVIPILGGFGNLDRFRAVRDGLPYEGMTIRLFQPATATWSVYWLDDRHLAVVPQVVGEMGESGGEFFGEETFDGSVVRQRFRWTHEEPERARWEQAYQQPDGAWETNWTMNFTRR